MPWLQTMGYLIMETKTKNDEQNQVAEFMEQLPLNVTLPSEEKVVATRAQSKALELIQATVSATVSATGFATGL